MSAGCLQNQHRDQPDITARGKSTCHPGRAQYADSPDLLGHVVLRSHSCGSLPCTATVAVSSTLRLLDSEAAPSGKQRF